MSQNRKPRSVAEAIAEVDTEKGRERLTAHLNSLPFPHFHISMRFPETAISSFESRQTEPSELECLLAETLSKSISTETLR